VRRLIFLESILIYVDIVLVRLNLIKAQDLAMSQQSTCCMEDELCVHLCLLFNTMLQHCYVPERFGYGLIIVPLLKDKYGDQSRSDMYRGLNIY